MSIGLKIGGCFLSLYLCVNFQKIHSKKDFLCDVCDDEQSDWNQLMILLYLSS